MKYRNDDSSLLLLSFCCFFKIHLGWVSYSQHSAQMSLLNNNKMKTGKDWNHHSCISQEWWLQQMTVIVLLINYPTAQLQCFIGMMIPMIHCFHRTCLGPKLIFRRKKSHVLIFFCCFTWKYTVPRPLIIQVLFWLHPIDVQIHFMAYSGHYISTYNSPCYLDSHW